MKKKLTAAMFALICVSLLATTLIACGGGHKHLYGEYWSSDAESHWHECRSYVGDCSQRKIDIAPHVDSDKDGYCDECRYYINPHVLTLVPAKESTCTERGNIAYYTCSHCDEWFSDEAAAYKIYDKDSVFIDTHHFVNGECTVCHTKQSSPNVYYTINEDGETVCAYRIEYFDGDPDQYPINVVIAADYKGLPVTKLGKNLILMDDSPIRSVVIPDSVIEIEERAFSGAINLKTVTMGKNIRVIGESAFSQSGITEIDLPDSLETVGNYAFHACENLQRVSLGNGLTELSQGMFNSCPLLTEIEIPSNIIKIGNNAFNSSGLVSLTIPGTVQEIEYNAFCMCENLESVTLQEGLKKLGDASEDKDKDGLSDYEQEDDDGDGQPDYKIVNGGLFWHCSKLCQVTLCNSLEEIGDTVFSACNISEVVFGSSLKRVGMHAFRDNKITSLTIPDNIEYLGYGAFMDNQIETLVLGTGLKEYRYAFSGNYDLANLTLSEGLTMIADSAFYKTKIASVTIPSTVTSIGMDAFGDCDNITELTIPQNVSMVYTALAWGCDNLKTVYWNATDCESNDDLVDPQSYYGYCGNFEMTKGSQFIIGSNVKKLGNKLFKECEFNDLTIPANVEEIGKACFENAKIASISFEVSNESESVTGLIRLGDNAFNDTFFSVAEIEIPETLTEVGDGSLNFYAGVSKLIWNAKDCKFVMSDPESLEATPFSGSDYEFVIGESVQKIGDNLFRNLDHTFLQNFDLSDHNITRIGDYAFYNSSLQTFTCNGDYYIGSYAIASCSGLKQLNLYGTARFENNTHAFANNHELKSVNIGIEIGAYAFYNCEKLQTVRINEGIHGAVKEHAFEGCTALSQIDWPFNIIGDYAFKDCTSLTNVTTSFNEDKYMDSEIGNYAFEGCTSLKTATFYKLKSLGEGVFKGCSALKAAQFDGTITTIPTLTFSDCTSLELVFICKTVKTISSNAFGNSPSLNTVNFEGSATDWLQIDIGSGNDTLESAQRNDGQFVDWHIENKYEN